MITSSPGIGKSSIMRSICKELNWEMIDHRLSTSVPEDMTGLPKFDADGFARFMPFADLFPLAQRELPVDEKGNKRNGWMLFLDEFNSGSKEVQAAAYKLVLDRMVGQYRLHDNVVITAAGNLESDRAIVNKLSTAMQSRLVHIEMVHNFDEWLEDVALVEQYDPRIIAYLSWKPDQLMDFRPDHQNKTFNCPRTWEFMNRLVKGNPVNDDRIALFAGTITSGSAASFVQYCSIYLNAITVKQILADPANCPVPRNDVALLWATVTSMMEAVDDQNFGPLSEYAARLDMGMRILFLRGSVAANPKLRDHPSFASAMTTLARYMFR